MADFRLQLTKILRQRGCRGVRNPPSGHEIWYSPIFDHTFPVKSPIRGRHYANLVLKQAGLPKEF